MGVVWFLVVFVFFFFFFFFKQKTAYEMCGRDWSSDVCSSDLFDRGIKVSGMADHIRVGVVGDDQIIALADGVHEDRKSVV